MIYLRRSLAVFLSLIFFVLLVVTIVMTQVALKVVDPGFYKEQLAQADVYEFILTDVATAAMEDARRMAPEDFPGELETNPFVSSGLTTEELVASFNRMAPPEWVQGQVEDFLDQVGGYVAGTRDEFTLQPQLGGQAAVIVDEMQALLIKADVYNLLYTEVVDPFVEENLADHLPFGVEVPPERLIEAVHAIFPPEWVSEQVNAAVDETTPYFTGQADSFSITVPLADRVDIALDELKAVLREADAYQVLYDEVVQPRVSESLGQVVGLPGGVTLTDAEVVEIMKAVAPLEWVQEQVEGLIDSAGAYVLGRTDEFVIQISLVENKADASAVLTELAERKLDDLVMSLRPCSDAETFQLAQEYATSGFTDVPPCLPSFISAEQLRDELPFDMADAVDSLVIANLPDEVTFSEDVLRGEFGPQDGQGGGGQGEGGEEEKSPLERLDQIREWMSTGYVFTSEDLKERLGESGTRLDSFREVLSDQWSYTHEDFRQDVAERGGQEALDNLDLVRANLKLARQLAWLAWLVLALVLVVIGFLGGRNWRSRIAWAAAPLVFFGLIITVAFGPVYSGITGNYVDRAKEQVLNDLDPNESFYQTQTLIINKMFDVVVDVPGQFVAGIRNVGIIMLVIGVVAIGATILYPRFSKPKPAATPEAGATT